MSVSVLLAFAATIAVFIGTAFLSFNNFFALYDVKALLIVFGGTIATTFICFPAPQVMMLFKVFFKRVMGKNKRNYGLLISEIEAVAKASYKGPKAVSSLLPNISDPFLREGAEILTWTENDVPDDNLRQLFEARAITHYRNYMSEAKIFRTIAKFPPAFGLMGTTLGMIALLQSLGDATQAKNMIGPGMAVALITTLYGLALANFIFIPIAENLTKQTDEDQAARMMVVEGLMLIRQKLPAPFIEEHVKSFLLPRQRPDGPSTGTSTGRGGGSIAA